ncbi:MAG: DUF2807 domain-containing protein [Bacteroidia bacterium]|nr:DUF2807 domain-containing protein [Bacteroidia bacterium]
MRFNSVVLVSFVFLLSAFKAKAQFHETRPVQEFKSIETLGSVSVYFTPSDTASMVVYASEKEIGNVETLFKNGKLIVSNKGKFTEPVKIYLKYKTLNSVDCGGASSFKTLDTLKTDSLSLSASGSANIKMTVESESISSIESGASHIKLSGTAQNLNAELSGASSLSAYDLNANTVKVSTTGASSAKVYCNSKMTAIAGGASTIKIKGDVKDISAEASPSSSITRILDKDSKTAGADGDSTVYNWNKKKIIIIDKDDEENGKNADFDFNNDYFSAYRHWAGFSFGVNGFMDKSFSTEFAAPNDYMNLNYAKSFNYQFNLFESHIPLVKHKLLIVTGFGFDYHSYELENKVRLNADADYTNAFVDSSGIYTYKKNRLRNTYIQVPLLLEFNSSNKTSKCFHMAAGVIGQYQILSRTRQLLENEAYEYDIQRKDPYNSNPFMLKAHVNLGYHRWTFYGEYSLTPFFQKNKGPELFPFAVGLRVVPFG